jgi:uncharacterized membrane protein YkoI
VLFIGRSGAAGHNVSMRGFRLPIRVGAAALALAWLGGPGAAAAGERADPDQDRARAAVRAGEAMPLPALLERVQRSHPGQVLRVELEQDDGRWVYELRVLQPDGRLLKLEVDARSGEVLEAKTRRHRRAPQAQAPA